MNICRLQSLCIFEREHFFEHTAIHSADFKCTDANLMKAEVDTVFTPCQLPQLRQGEVACQKQQPTVSSLIRCAYSQRLLPIHVDIYNNLKFVIDVTIIDEPL